MTLRGVFGGGTPYAGSGGQGFQPGHWRADKPSGKVAVPEGPQAPRQIPQATLPPARQATVENRAAREAALTPRRYQPPYRDDSDA